MTHQLEVHVKLFTTVTRHFKPDILSSFHHKRPTLHTEAQTKGSSLSPDTLHPHKDIPIFLNPHKAIPVYTYFPATTIYIYIKCKHKKVLEQERKTFFFNEQKVGMLLQKRTDTRGVGISSMRKSIYLLTTTPTSHTHTFHPLSTIVIHTFNFAQVKSMDDNCGEWVECMGVASGCGEQEVGVASGSGWNLRVWLVGVVVRRYIDFLILLIPTPLVSVLFCRQQHPYFLFIFFLMFFVLVPVLFCIFILCIKKFFSRSINTNTGNYRHPTAAI